MGKLLDYIAKETQGECFASFKYCYDNMLPPNIEYEAKEDSYINMKEFAESIHDPHMRDMCPLAEKMRSMPPLFKFFLDGSRRVYKVDDIQYDKKVFPIVSGQISVSCCVREMNDDNTFRSFGKVFEEAYPVVCLPITANDEGIDNGVYFNNLCNKLNELPFIKGSGNKFGKVLYYLTKIEGNETLENKGIARIQDEMIECEKRIVAEMMSKHLLTHDRYLIKDGSIQYKPMKTGDYKELARIRNNYRHVVGVSKRFNPNLMKDNKNQSSAGQIAKLPLFHRTPAFMWKPGEEWGNVNFAIWYVRIRERKYTATPYSGILKIEKMLMTGKEAENGLESDEIDMITANIINERNPVCYGNDARWANHLYPVYMTECYCKSRFKSDMSFINLF
ncbi:hypothetical protein [uncultured Alistipes sp.]|uniref:hypothetical protein n=1 Tax=uncultured Alistipes sp. TaxID=538949 RepID=UPI00272A4DEF|nr:hypothetical protein [uncultured Alistipes sp.]